MLSPLVASGSPPADISEPSTLPMPDDTRDDCKLWKSLLFSSEDKMDKQIKFPKEVNVYIDMHGVHFYPPDSLKRLHFAKLCDIKKYGWSKTSVFFYMKVGDVCDIYEFQTVQGEDMCVAFQVQIQNALERRSGAANRDLQRSLSEANTQGLRELELEDKLRVQGEVVRELMTENLSLKKQVSDLENLYQEERRSRIKYFNMVEDMKRLLSSTAL